MALTNFLLFTSAHVTVRQFLILSSRFARTRHLSKCRYTLQTNCTIFFAHPARPRRFQRNNDEEVNWYHRGERSYFSDNISCLLAPNRYSRNGIWLKDAADTSIVSFVRDRARSRERKIVPRFRSLTCRSRANRSPVYNAAGTVYEITKDPRGNRRWRGEGGRISLEVGNRKKIVTAGKRRGVKGEVGWEVRVKTINKLLLSQQRLGFMGLHCPVYGRALCDGKATWPRFLSATISRFPFSLLTLLFLVLVGVGGWAKPVVCKPPCMNFSQSHVHKHMLCRVKIVRMLGF